MAGLISPATIEQIRNANDIVDVIGSYLPLKRAGANFVTLCPFHKEKTPSFSVNPHRQIFHCFGCHKGGDVFTFVREYENLSFVEAAQRLAQRASIALEFEQQPGEQKARHLKETLWQIHEQITQRWQAALTNDAAGHVARDYLAKRGVSAEAIKQFRLGYAPEAWDDTVNWARSKGYELSLVEQAGLILRKEGSDHYYDRFRGRLIFPICDEQGRVAAFSGRVLSGDEKTAKYVNSPETPIFTKGKVFYGLDKSKRAILDAGFAIICEGQLDLIACHMAGVTNVVAPQGTAFTADHARILKRYVEEVVLCFDSDSAGQAAAVRALDSLLASGLAIRVATVPPPHDPDSYIKAEGGAAFQRLITEAKGFFEHYLDLLCSTHDLRTDRGRLAVARSMGEALFKTGSAVLIDTHAQRTAQRLGVSVEAVRAEFRKTQRHRPAGPEAAEPASATPAPTPPSNRELWLLRWLLASEEAAAWAAAHLRLEWVQHPVVRRILALRLEAVTAGTWRGVPDLLMRCEEPQAQDLITRSAVETLDTDNLLAQTTEAVRLLRNEAIDQQLAELRLRLAQPTISEGEVADLVLQQKELRGVKQRPMEPLTP